MVMSWNTCKMPDCEAYTARPDGDYCESCRRANAKEETENQKSLSKRAAQLQKQKAKNQLPRKRVNPVSEKRKELNKEYSSLAAQFKFEHPFCEIRANEYCTVKTDDVHHPAGRVGVNFLDVTKWKAACRSCHQYAHDHPKEAIEKGWSESKLATIKPTI